LGERLDRVDSRTELVGVGVKGHSNKGQIVVPRLGLDALEKHLATRPYSSANP
jgi:hypothetical protein